MERRGGKTVWHKDDYFVVMWAIQERHGADWFEFTISRPNVGSQGTQLDPVVDGVVTHGRSEFATLGAFDGSVVHLTLALHEALNIARQEGF